MYRRFFSVLSGSCKTFFIGNHRQAGSSPMFPFVKVASKGWHNRSRIALVQYAPRVWDEQSNRNIWINTRNPATMCLVASIFRYFPDLGLLRTFAFFCWVFHWHVPCSGRHGFHLMASASTVQVPQSLPMTAQKNALNRMMKMWGCRWA